jgi:hypothetical protein
MTGGIIFVFLFYFPSYILSFLQVLLSQSHRFRALVLLGRFLDMGPWAVDLVCTDLLCMYILMKCLLFFLFSFQPLALHCRRPCLSEYFLMYSNCFKQVQWSCVKFLCLYGQKFSLLIRYALFIVIF